MKAKNNLLIDCHVFDEIYQGTTTFLSNLIQGLIDGNYELDIFLCAYDTCKLEQLFGIHDNVKYVKLNSLNKFYRLSYDIPRIIIRNNINYALFNYILPFFRPSKCNYLLVVHDVLFKDFPIYYSWHYRLRLNVLISLSIRKCQRLYTVSNYSAERLLYYYDFVQSVSVIPNSIGKRYVSFYNSHSNPRNLLNSDCEYLKYKYNIEHYLLYVSRIEPRKNHKTLIEVYEELELWRQGIKLVFVGAMAFSDQNFRKTLDRVNVKSNYNILLLDGVSDDDLIVLYKNARINFYLSICEGFGIPPLESAYIGTSTICSKLTAMSDYDFFGNFHVNPEDKGEIKEAVKCLLDKSEDEELETIANLIAIKYSVESMAASFYRSL